MSSSTLRPTVLVTSAGVATASNVINALKLARDMKVRTVAVDVNPYAVGLHRADAGYLVPPCSDPGYVDSLLALCKREQIDFIYSLYSKEILLIAEHAEEFAAVGTKTMLPPPDVARTCTDKARFLAFLDEAGFTFPATHRFEDVVESDLPLFIKPREGSSSKNTFRIDSMEDLRFYHGKNTDCVIQDFIDGTEYTVDCLVNDGEVLVCMPRVRVLVKDGKSMVGKIVNHPKLVEETVRLLQKIGMHGPCNVQWLEDAAGDLYSVEINPRLSAGGLPLTVRAGANIPEMMLCLALGESVAPVREYPEGLVMARYLEEIFIKDDKVVPCIK